MTPRARPEGIVVRHSVRCVGASGAKGCNCRPGYQAQVYSPAERRTIRRTFKALGDARAWRAETKAALERGSLRAPSHQTLEQAAQDWVKAANAGVIRTRSGDAYKPGALRGYEQALRARVIPRFGHLKTSALHRIAVQDLVDEMLAAGLAPSTVRNAILPLRAIYRRLLARSEVAINPTLGLALPASRERRERVARPGEAQQLLEALSPADRAVWATALYAGLRRGELRALRWGDVDFGAGLIRVERGWDPKEGPIEPKSRAGKRRVPLAKPLRAQLAAHRLRTAGTQEDLVFRGRGGKPLAPDALIERARKSGVMLALSRSGCTSAATPTPPS